MQGTDRPWIYASGQRGVKRIAVQLAPSISVVSLPVEEAPKIDGQFTEPCWDQAKLEGASRIRMRPPSRYYRDYWDRMQEQESLTDWCLIRHDKENVYFAFFDAPMVDRKGVATPWRKAATEPDDRKVWSDHHYAVFLTDARRSKIAQFAVSASGSRHDALHTGDQKNSDVSWNGNWRASVLADEKGFRAEIAIPRKTLEDLGLDPEALGINLTAFTGGSYGFHSLMTVGRFVGELMSSYAPLGLGSPPPAPERPFTVRLHFAESDDVAVGQRVFDVKLQGATVLQDFDILKVAGARDTAVVREFKGVKATTELVVEFVPKTSATDERTAPILCGFEFCDEAFTPQEIPEEQ